MYHGGGSSAQKEEEDYVTQTPSEERKGEEPRRCFNKFANPRSEGRRGREEEEGGKNWRRGCKSPLA